MDFLICTLNEGKANSLCINVPEVYKACLDYATLKSLDPILGVVMTKEYLIVLTENPGFRDGQRPTSIYVDSVPANNINAYHWDGTHAWNIADIVGDIRTYFYRCTPCSSEYVMGVPEVANHPEIWDHEFIEASTADFYYLTDITDKKLIRKEFHK